jgi:uncharacterized membrane protein YhhN
MTLVALAAVMALFLVGLLAAEVLDKRSWVVVLKPLASLVFLVAGVLFLPLPEKPALLLFTGLVLSFVGDVLLIPKGRKVTFLLGLASFLCAHVAYSLAFVLRGTEARGVLVGGVVLVAGGVPLARWLLPHVKGAMRPPVVGYIVAITAMVALSSGAFAAGAPWTLLAGAVLFYLSDLCVARERFVAKSMWNGVVGLPLYYVAQLLLVDGLSSTTIVAP